MNHAEAVAKRALEAILPATMEYQPEQSHGEYDFELRYHNGATGAVEVTAAMDQTQAQTSAAIRCKKNGGSVIQPRRCAKSWMIFPTMGASIRKIREAADEYLFRLEQEGIENFSCVRGGPRSVYDVCRDLSLTSGSVIRTVESAKILIAHPIGGGAVGPRLAIEAGEREAWKKDNRRKLRAAKTAEHHFVVYIDTANGLPWIALTDFEPPSVLPNLPEEITSMWLVGHGNKANEFVVWCANSKQPWRSLRAESVDTP